MRTFALFLILANACFFGWALLIDTPQSQGGANTIAATATPRLRLAAERPVSTAAADGADAAASHAGAAQSATQTAMAARTCISVGPYQDAAAAAQASASLAESGLSVQQREEQGEVWVGYWVNLPNAGTAAEAEQKLARLKSGGIDDAYALPGSPATISLGVFAEHARAQRRMEEVRGLGFEPQLSDRKREGSLYWIDIQLKQPGQLLDPALLQSSGAIVRLETRDCAAAG